MANVRRRAASVEGRGELDGPRSTDADSAVIAEVP
jgi:hypothetical protein